MFKHRLLYSRMVLFIFLSFVGVVGYLFFKLIRGNEYWAEYSFPWEKIIWVIGSTFVPILAKILSVRKSEEFFARAFVGIWIFILSLFLVYCKIDNVAPTIFFVSMLFVAVAEMGYRLNSVFKLKKQVLVIEFLIGTVTYHHILFMQTTFNLLNASLSYIILIGFLGSAVFRLLKNRNKFSIRLKSINLSFDFVEGLLISWLIAILLLAFITMASPQTHSDGIVERLPYLYQLAKSGTFPFHYFKWALLIPLPMNLVLIPSYFFSSDLGASINLYLYVLALCFLLLKFLNYLKIDRKIALGTLGLIFSLPPVWLITTNIYFDVSIAVYCLAGLLFVLKSVPENSKSNLIWGFLFWGFAASIKMNAAVFIFAFLSALLFFDTSYRQFILSNFKVAIFSFLVAWVPWAIRSYLVTGNPFFPFFEFLTSPLFSGASILNSQATSSYFFEGNFGSFISFPWDMVFHTERFGEYLPGTYGPTLLFLFPLIVLGFILSIKSKSWEKRDRLLFFAGLLTIFLTSYSLKASIFRYWVGGFILSILILGKFVQSFLQYFSSKVFKAIFVVMVPLNFAFLLLIGSRINYGLPYGIGDSIWFGKQSVESFVDNVTLGIPDFVNSIIEDGESIFITHFFYANHLRAPSIYVSDNKSLLGLFESYDKVNRFIENYKVRYWIVQSNMPFEMDPKIKERYWRNEAIVYASGDYVVYDLSGKRRASKQTLVYENKVGGDDRWTDLSETHYLDTLTFTNPGWLKVNSVESATFLKLEMDIEVGPASSIFVGQIIGFNAKGEEIQRRLITRSLSPGKNAVVFYSDLNKRPKTIRVHVSPWHVQDGTYKLEKTKIDFF